MRWCVVAMTVLPAEPPRSKGIVLISPALRVTLMVRGLFGLRLPGWSTSSAEAEGAEVENFLPCSVKSIAVHGCGPALTMASVEKVPSSSHWHHHFVVRLGNRTPENETTSWKPGH